MSRPTPQLAQARDAAADRARRAVRRVAWRACWRDAAGLRRISASTRARCWRRAARESYLDHDRAARSSRSCAASAAGWRTRARSCTWRRAARRAAVALTDFMALEAAGWKGRAGGAARAHAATEAFMREAVTALAAKGDARIDRLIHDGHPVAASITLRSGNARVVLEDRLRRGVRARLAGRAAHARPHRAICSPTPRWRRPTPAPPPIIR